MNLKTTYKWMWPGSRDPISKFWNPLITGKTSKVYLLKLFKGIYTGILTIIKQQI